MKLILVVVASLVLFGAACSPFSQFDIWPVKVLGEAMNPELHDGDRIFIRREFEKLERGDIVVFHHPHDHGKSFLKRIIGVPHDKVEIRKGEVLVNGKELAEPYVDPENSHFWESNKTVVVPPDSFYVLGDNRDQSSDSRFFGSVPRKLIYGKFACKYYSARSSNWE